MSDPALGPWGAGLPNYRRGGGGVDPRDVQRLMDEHNAIMEQEAKDFNDFNAFTMSQIYAYMFTLEQFTRKNEDGEDIIIARKDDFMRMYYEKRKEICEHRYPNQPVFEILHDDFPLIEGKREKEREEEKRLNEAILNDPKEQKESQLNIPRVPLDVAKRTTLEHLKCITLEGFERAMDNQGEGRVPLEEVLNVVVYPYFRSEDMRVRKMNRTTLSRTFDERRQAEIYVQESIRKMSHMELLKFWEKMPEAQSEFKELAQSENSNDHFEELKEKFKAFRWERYKDECLEDLGYTYKRLDFILDRFRVAKFSDLPENIQKNDPAFTLQAKKNTLEQALFGAMYETAMVDKPELGLENPRRLFVKEIQERGLTDIPTDINMYDNPEKSDKLEDSRQTEKITDNSPEAWEKRLKEKNSSKVSFMQGIKEKLNSKKKGKQQKESSPPDDDISPDV